MTFRLASDSGSVTENASRTSNVLANDTSAVRVTQVKAGSGAYSPVTSAGTIIEGTYGVLTISSTGAYTYTASKADALAKGKTASDTFTYSAASSSGTTASTTLKITVTGANDAPVITAPAFALNAIDEDQIANTGQTATSIARSSDVDNGALHGMAITSLVSGNGQWQYSINAGASWANVGPVSDTSALLLRATDLIRFIPNGIDGTDANFTYRAWDQTSGSTGTKVNPGAGGGITAYSTVSSTATIAVASVNDAPVAQAASATGDEDGPPITGQLHASDVDSAVLSYALVADSSVGGTTAIDPNTGAYSFVPNANFSGAASFKFIASDGGASSAAAAVAITIVPINDPPVAVADTASTPQDISVLVNVLANDSDPENDILSLARVEGSTHGTVAIENGQVRYVPNAGFVGSDGFIYTVADSNGATAIANGTVAVVANAGPVTIVLDQDYGYGQYRVTALPAHSIIDATTASWIVDNSRNDNPTAANPSTSGTGPINTYPFRVDSAGSGLMIKGGTIWGQVPQDSDWDYTYTNSAAIRVAASPDVIIDHWRIDKAWDAIRIANGTSNFLIDDAYVTNNRDDAVEDDYVMGGTIRDSLFDGTFSGISIGDGDHWDGSMNTITLESVFMRNKPYLFHGAVTHVSPIKTDTGMPSTTPDIRIINSVFAIEDPSHASQARLQLAWDNLVESHGNVFLNLSDAPLPATYPALPSGFTLLQGQVARDYWDATRTAWLDNHDGVDDVPITPLPPIPDPVPSDVLTG